MRDFTPKETARLTGRKEADLVTAAQWFGASPATLSLYCQGLNQRSSGSDKNVALINLHLATGQIGKPGAGPFSLTGQSNAMGGREVGGMANLLSGHRGLMPGASRPAGALSCGRICGQTCGQTPWDPRHAPPPDLHQLPPRRCRRLCARRL